MNQKLRLHIALIKHSNSGSFFSRPLDLYDVIENSQPFYLTDVTEYNKV